MNKTYTIFINELVTTLKRKGFILTTLSFPVLGILAILIFNLVNGMSSTSTTTNEIPRVGYVDQVGIFTDYNQHNNIELVAYPSAEQANGDLVAGKIQEYFIIPKDYVATGLITRYTQKTELEPPSDVMYATQSFLVDNLVKDKVDEATAARIKAPLALSNVVLDKTGNVAEGQNGWGAYAISYLFAILLVMSIFTASGYLLQGLSEEKENRIMEVLLSSVTTRQLITGKVLALGVSGLIQIVIWLISGYALIGLASSSIGGFFATLTFPPSVIFLSLIYFILGYFIFAILMAGVGAIAPTQRDGQQMSVIFTLFAMVPYFLMAFIIENGEHIVTRILTFFPLTAPLTAMMRVNSGIPAWELAVSIVILLLSIWGCLLLASRVFRVYLLMYGKAPGWREVLKSIREA